MKRAPDFTTEMLLRGTKCAGMLRHTPLAKIRGLNEQATQKTRQIFALIE
jgi:hypothetical protein